jgi:hypothetical protein
MARRLIRYRTRPDRADANQRLVEAVFTELQARNPEGVRYLVLRTPEGAFFHLVAFENGGGTSALTTLPAFQEFQRELRARCSEPPEAMEVTVVGNHRMLPD